MIGILNKFVGATVGICFSCLLIEIAPIQAATTPVQAASTTYSFKQENFEPFDGILSGTFSGEDLNGDGLLQGKSIPSISGLSGELSDFSINFRSFRAIPIPLFSEGISFNSRTIGLIPFGSIDATYSLMGNYLTFRANDEFNSISVDLQGSGLFLQTPFGTSESPIEVEIRSSAPLVVQRVSSPVTSVPEPSTIVCLSVLSLTGLRSVSKRSRGLDWGLWFRG